MTKSLTTGKKMKEYIVIMFTVTMNMQGAQTPRWNNGTRVERAPVRIECSSENIMQKYSRALNESRSAMRRNIVKNTSLSQRQGKSHLTVWHWTRASIPLVVSISSSRRIRMQAWQWWRHWDERHRIMNVLMKHIAPIAQQNRQTRCAACARGTAHTGRKTSSRTAGRVYLSWSRRHCKADRM